MFWKKKKKPKQVWEPVTREIDIGEVDIIIVLKNGEEHTLNYQGYYTLPTEGWPFLSVTSVKDLIEYIRYDLNMESSRPRNFIPVKMINNVPSQYVNSNDVFKIKIGEYQSKLITITYNNWVQVDE